MLVSKPADAHICFLKSSFARVVWRCLCLETVDTVEMLELCGQNQDISIGRLMTPSE